MTVTSLIKTKNTCHTINTPDARRYDVNDIMIISRKQNRCNVSDMTCGVSEGDSGSGGQGGEEARCPRPGVTAGTH